MIITFITGFIFVIGALAAVVIFLLILGAWDQRQTSVPTSRGVDPGEEPYRARRAPEIPNIAKARVRKI